MTNETQHSTQTTLSDRIRHLTDDWSQVVGGALHKTGVHPNLVSAVGLLLVAAGSVLAARGQLVGAGWLVLLGSLCDGLDGAVARARGAPDPFGGVWDSTLDRYADGFIFASLSYYFASQNQTELMLLPLVALMGSYAVSYVRARADSPDVNLVVKIGAFTRFERLAVIVWSLWLHGWLLLPGLWLLAVGTNLTAAQRL